ncbi:hypothetical protein F4824DRAFT_178133 [Ustulina deusta]|nr:hypothetical protein F4824DRAFT_178133 [Ustulina deusta]
MSPPLPLPSKAAIRALRSIVLGTSCAIGVIVEDRRRRISTLKAVVANKQKLKSARQYRPGGRQKLDQLPGLPDDAAPAGPNLQRHEREGEGRGKHGNAETAGPENAILEDVESHDPSHEDSSQQHVQASQPSPSQSSPPQPATSQQPPVLARRRIPTPLASQSMGDSMISKTIKPSQPSASSVAQRCQNALILSIENLLASTDENRLDQAILLLVLNSPSVCSSSQRDRWIELSARVSQECQASGRWEDASRILSTIIELTPLNETQYFAYNPLPIIEFHLRQPNIDTPRSTESIIAAAKLYLAKLHEQHGARGIHMEDVGWLLVRETLSLKRFAVALHVYWRMLGWVENQERCTSLAIRTFSQHRDHKAVFKIFLLHYSRVEPASEYFDETMDHVIASVEAMKGLQASSILEAIAQMKCPNGRLRSRWIMQVLRAYWTRRENIYKTEEMFEKIVSLGLLEKINHPEGVYRTFVEIAAKAGETEMAYAYADKVVHDYPEMRDDIALKLALLKAKAGDWDGVLATFRRVRPSELAGPASYRSAFVLVLKVFAESHSAAETQDFAMLFVRELGVGFHLHMVTLVAKRYGQARDMKGFIVWLDLCSQEGFAINAGFCNSVLYNCWAKWKISFPELRMVHAKFKALNPDCFDAVTQRIMSQAAQRTGRGHMNVRPGKMITVDKMAYSGRSTNKWDIFEAMNQELMDGRATSAVNIYKSALDYGMPFSSHCLRLAVLAALQAKAFGFGPALTMIQDAHAQGHDVGPAVSTFIRRQVAEFQGSPEDVVIHMRNLISRFESSQIAIAPAVLTHMATICVKVGEYEKAISLCQLARHRSGSSELCFSSQSFRALATAYSNLLDVGGMNALIDSMCESEYSADKEPLLHLQSIRRQVEKIHPSDAKTALLDVIERGIRHLTHTRTKIRIQGNVISQETLQIYGDALTDLEAKKAAGQIPSCTVPYGTERGYLGFFNAPP